MAAFDGGSMNSAPPCGRAPQHLFQRPPGTRGRIAPDLGLGGGVFVAEEGLKEGVDAGVELGTVSPQVL